MMVDPVFVLMPAYNAGSTVEKVFARIPPTARERVKRYVIANDGSKDDTAAALERVAGAVENLVEAGGVAFGLLDGESLRRAFGGHVHETAAPRDHAGAGPGHHERVLAGAKLLAGFANAGHIRQPKLLGSAVSAARELIVENA